MKSQKFYWTILLLLCAGGAWAEVSVSAARARATLPGQDVSVAYLDFANRGDDPCPLRGLSSPQVPRVEIHEHRHQNGQMMMRQVQDFALPPGATTRLSPGGLHLMLMGLQAPLAAGGEVDINFDFDQCGQVRARFPVRAASEM
jgi:copper(I)-binding protein